jgi:hypothetical protein
LQKAVLSYVVTHPSDAAAHARQQLTAFAEAPTASSGSADPVGAENALRAYRLVLHALFILLPFGLAIDLAWRIRRRVRRIVIADDAGEWGRALLCWAAAAVTLLFAVGEAAEQYRFVLSVAPFLALVPWFLLDVGLALARSFRYSSAASAIAGRWPMR